MAQRVTNQTSNYEDFDLILGLARWVKDFGHRCHSDPALLWLWHRLEAAAPSLGTSICQRCDPKKNQKKKKKKPRETRMNQGPPSNQVLQKSQQNY